MDPKSVRALLVRLGLTAGLGSSLMACDPNSPIVRNPPPAQGGTAGTSGTGGAGGTGGTNGGTAGSGGGGDPGTGGAAANPLGNALNPYPLDGGGGAGAGDGGGDTVTVGPFPHGNPPPPWDAGGGADDAAKPDQTTGSDGSGG